MPKPYPYFNRYMERLLQIEEANRERISVFHDGSNPFEEFVSRIQGKEMSLNDYLKIQMMFYNRYAKRSERRPLSEGELQRLTRAQMCVLLQCQMLLESVKQPSLRLYYPHLKYEGQVDPELQEFVHRKRPFYRVLVTKSEDHLLGLICLGACLGLIVLCLVLGLPFWFSLVLVVVLSVLAGYVCFHKVVPSLIQDRIRRLQPKLDVAHQSFEQAMSGRPPLKKEGSSS